MNVYIYDLIFNYGAKIVGWEDSFVCLNHTGDGKYWYLNGLLHRADGPAIEYAHGNKHWYLNGKLHRKDGPAVEYSHGSKSWYLNGKQYTEEEFNTIQSTEK